MDEQKDIDLGLDTRKFQEELGTSAIKGKAVGKTQGALTGEVCDKVLDEITKKKSLKSKEMAMALIAGLAQNGGSNQNAGASVSYTIMGHTLTATELRTILTTIQRGATVRQLCRTLRNEIYAFAKILGEEGDLAKQMRLSNPNLSHEDAIWCSNFQTTNPSCQDTVRNWLTANYEKRFNR